MAPSLRPLPKAYFVASLSGTEEPDDLISVVSLRIHPGNLQLRGHWSRLRELVDRPFRLMSVKPGKDQKPDLITRVPDMKSNRKFHRYVAGTGARLSLSVAAMLALAGLASAQTTTNGKTRSISEFVRGSAETDNWEGVTKAFEAASQEGFVLVVDRPVFIHVGTDVERPIFVDNNTTVRFTKEGRFILDNELIPSFVIANSSNINFENWQIEYVGETPVDKASVTGYYMKGVFHPEPGSHAPVAGGFNDSTLTHWLAMHRHVRFDNILGGVHELWHGPTNPHSIFYVIGECANISVQHMKAFVPQNAPVNRFLPMLFSSLSGFRSDRTVTSKSAFTDANVAIPRKFTFNDIDLDGYYFGWQGEYLESTFNHIRAHRYGDLEAPDGSNGGGKDKWYAPPHLFYLNDDTSYTKKPNSDVTITDVIDYGNRVGHARDLPGSVKLSGYANSLKIGGKDILVSGYVSYRPDGLFDLLRCDNMTIRDVTATYDSSFINDLFFGIRFPDKEYHDLVLENISLTDVAPRTIKAPISDNHDNGNRNIQFRNVRVYIHQWAGPKTPQPIFAGTGHSLDLQIMRH